MRKALLTLTAALIMLTAMTACGNTPEVMPEYDSESEDYDFQGMTFRYLTDITSNS